MCIDSVRVLEDDGFPRSEAEFSEGVLVMQVLLISQWRHFDQEMWR